MPKQTSPPRRNGFVSTRVSTLPAGTYTDPGQKGLQLRVRENQDGKASRTWLLRFKFQGDETRILLGHFPATTLDAARGEARKLRELAAQGIDPRRARPRRIERPSPLALSAAPSSGKHTVDNMVSEFIERYIRPRRKRPDYAINILNSKVLPKWHGRDARTIKPYEVIELLDGIVDAGAPVMANRTAGLLTQLFRFGVHRTIIETSPVQLLYRPGGDEKPRERSLSDEELKAFFNLGRAATRLEKLTHVVVILLLSGQRRGELALARWSQVDFDKLTWTIPPENSKTGKGHVVPLSVMAAEEFRALHRLANKSLWVLPAPDIKNPIEPKQLTRAVARHQGRFKKAGIAPFTLHDLRRTCRTGLSKLKIEPHIAERCLNHAQEKIPGTYDTHDYLEEKRHALDLWAAHVAGLRA